jgi:hypothetical protein
MSFFVIMRNLGSIIAFFRTLSAFVSEWAKTRHAPNCDSFADLIKQARVLMEKGVIDIPGVDEKDIIEALKGIEEQIVCRVK